MGRRAICAGVACSILSLWCALLSGCLERELKPLTPCVVSGVVQTVQVDSIEKVDLLFMVDNSNSMQEEQESLAREFPRLVEVLASGDLDGDGREDFSPVRDLNIGVISSDMGSGGFPVDTCSGAGDDGVLFSSAAQPELEACSPPPRLAAGSFLNFRPGEVVDVASGAAELAREFECLARLGTGGCGFEQQLEAALKALTPSTCGGGEIPQPSHCAFWSPSGVTPGHGDGANQGFVRDDSLLAVIMVTDEEDCSVNDPGLFNGDEENALYPGALNLRCFEYPEALHGIEARYVPGFRSLRDNPELFVFAAIVGIPTDLAPSVNDCESDEDCSGASFCVSAGREQGGHCQTDFQRILDDERMREQIDYGPVGKGNALVPSCNNAGTGKAYPPRRIVKTVELLEAAGANGIVQSICQEDFRPALDAIIRKIADALGGACLPRPLNPDDDGLVDCNVVETLPRAGEITRCDQLAANGREFARIDGQGREVCKIAQVPIGDVDAETRQTLSGALGWFYEANTADVRMRCEDKPQRISFVEGAEPPNGAAIRLECLQTLGQVTGPTEEAASDVTLGSPCRGAGACDSGDMSLFDLECDDATNTCQPLCQTDADCKSLGGFVCDTASPVPVCRNPTCTPGS